MCAGIRGKIRSGYQMEKRCEFLTLLGIAAALIACGVLASANTVPAIVAPYDVIS